MQKLWLYLHFPSLQLDSLLQQEVTQQAATQNSHDLHNRQAYIILNEQNNQICQLNQVAYQAGIRFGMGLGTAAMLKSELQVVLYQEKINQNILNDIAHNLYIVTSDISIQSPHGLLLQVHNMLQMYGGLENYWQAVQHQLPTQNTHFHYATGNTPLAAKILATTSWDIITANTQKISQATHSISLQHTELSLSVIKKLDRVGIRNIQDLLRLPLADLAKRFDADVATYIGKLTNQIPHIIHFFHPKKIFERYLELLFDMENIQAIHRPLQLLLECLEQFLKSRDLLTQTLNIELHQRDKQSIKLNVNSQQGEYSSKAWLPLISLKLENTKLNAPIFAICLRVDNTYIRAPDEQDLFSAKQGTFSRLQLISLLQAKLGELAVYTPKLANDFRPELMIEVNQPNANQISSNRLSTKQADKIKLQAMRPSLLLTSPERLTEKVSIIYGPERIETAWWDSQGIIRDYFVAKNPQGQWFWVFKTPTGEWYLHGVFS
jgi:protein ImuB